MQNDPLNRANVKRGQDLPQSRLTEDDVRTIRELIDQRSELLLQARELSNRKIAERFGVHFRTIERIATGETWGHVEQRAHTTEPK